MADENNEIIEIPHGLDSFATSPKNVVERSAEIANALKPIIKERKLYVEIQGKPYINVEGWTTLGAMLGVTPHEVASVRHEDGSWEGTVELRSVTTGQQVGRASAICGTPDDKPWCNRAEPARKSMATTRATGKAFRLGFSFLIKLAGYEVTPAEEMPATKSSGGNLPSSGDLGGGSSKSSRTTTASSREGHASPRSVALPPIPQRKRKPEIEKVRYPDPGVAVPPTPQRKSANSKGSLSASQFKLLHATANKAELSHERLKGCLDAEHGIASTKEIPPALFDDILEAIRSGEWT